MPCGKRYWLPTVNYCLKELCWKSGRVPVLSSTLQQFNHTSKIFAFEKMNHFSLVFKWYIEKDLNLKVCFFRKSNISWHQQKTKIIVKYHAQLQKGFGWSFVVLLPLQQCNRKKTRLYEKLMHFCSTRNFCWHQQNWPVTLKNYYLCLFNINWFQNVPSFIAIMHIVQKLQTGHFWHSSSKKNMLSQITK